MFNRIKSNFELLQTQHSVEGQVEELYRQIISSSDKPLVLAGYSWGAWLAVLTATKYPDCVRKLILIGSAPFDPEYVSDLLPARLSRLPEDEKKEAMKIISAIDSGNVSNELFRRFGALMEKADSYQLIPVNGETGIDLNMDIFQHVWGEAVKLRESGELLKAVEKLKCPVVAIHGDYDPHPAAGVEKPLSERLNDFRMIVLEKCGHTPWKEVFAKDRFYSILKEEIIHS